MTTIVRIAVRIGERTITSLAAGVVWRHGSHPRFHSSGHSIGGSRRRSEASGFYREDLCCRKGMLGSRLWASLALYQESPLGLWMRKQLVGQWGATITSPTTRLTEDINEIIIMRREREFLLRCGHLVVHAGVASGLRPLVLSLIYKLVP
jgi:hypothetical protein